MIGENVRINREQHGYTQFDLAAKVGVCQPTISNWESKGMNPNLPRELALDPFDVGARIYFFRRAAGYSQQRLAEAIGVSDSTLCKWETGKVLPRLSSLMNLCVVFDCLPSALTGNKDTDFLASLYL